MRLQKCAKLTDARASVAAVSVVGGWVLVPLVLALVAVGLGLLLERGCSVRLPGALVPVAGLAGLIVVAGILTVSDATAEVAVPVTAVLAAVGVALGRPWADSRLGRTALAPIGAAVLTYVVFAAPSLLTGQASVAGYVKLDDTPTWLAQTAYVLEHGRDTSDLPVSSYGRTIGAWLGGGYPVGAFLPLGAGARLAGQDPAGAYQAVIAFLAALLALGLFAVAGPFCGNRRAALLAGFLGAQASLFYGYAQWGGIKEAAAAALLPPLAVLSLRAGRDARLLPALAVVAGALLAVLGPNGMAWVGPALLVAAVAASRPPRPAIRRRAMAAGAAAFAVASIPVLATVDFIEHTQAGAISRQSELGNLAGPLSLLQAAGLWPAGDFRQEPSPRWFAVALALTCAAAALAAAVVAVRARRLELPVLLGLTLAGAVPAVVVGSPWVDAKALALVSPMILAAAVAIGARPVATPRPWSLAASSALMLVVPAGVAWSTLASIDGVQVAPRERLAEARSVGEQVRASAPALLLDPDIYASRYFLREADGEGASDLRVRPVARRDGGTFARLTTAEVDDVALPDLWIYRSIVRRPSPTAGRPPSAFAIAHRGRFWEAWRKSPGASPPLARLPLSGADDPTAVPRCPDVRKLARTPDVRELAAVPRRPPVVATLEPALVPRSWRAADGIRPRADGNAVVTVQVPEAGRWRIWVGGTVLGRLDVRVDGRAVGHLRHVLAHGSHWMRFASLPLSAGPHRVELRYRARLRAGTGRLVPVLGPVALSPEEPLEVLRLPAARWRDLCDGRAYDWVEALG